MLTVIEECLHTPKSLVDVDELIILRRHALANIRLYNLILNQFITVYVVLQI